MSTVPDSQAAELNDFIETLKVHNKDLDACFNDAVAVQHLKLLVDREKAKAVAKAQIEECNILIGVRPQNGLRGYRAYAKDRLQMHKQRLASLTSGEADDTTASQ